MDVLPRDPFHENSPSAGVSFARVLPVTEGKFLCSFLEGQTLTQSSESSSPAAVASQPALKLKFLSHGTLESKDLDFTRRFYEEFLGLEVHRTSPISLMVRLGGDHVYAVVFSKRVNGMGFLNHNGLDVETQADVDAAHRTTCEQAEKWGLHKISEPALQHGTYSFYFWDADENCWEILTNPKGGYSWLFALGDLEGKGHIDRTFQRPG
jgi:catechol 2,3-dioxygenase-like lactoylglutathione lyase family enzyme